MNTQLFSCLVLVSFLIHHGHPWCALQAQLEDMEMMEKNEREEGIKQLSSGPTTTIKKPVDSPSKASISIAWYCSHRPLLTIPNHLPHPHHHHHQERPLFHKFGKATLSTPTPPPIDASSSTCLDMRKPPSDDASARSHQPHHHRCYNNAKPLKSTISPSFPCPRDDAATLAAAGKYQAGPPAAAATASRWAYQQPVRRKRQRASQILFLDDASPTMLGSALEHRRVEPNGHRSSYLQKPVAQRIPRGGGNSECKMITDFLTEAGITHITSSPPPPPTNRPGGSQGHRPQHSQLQPHQTQAGGTPTNVDRHEGTVWQEGEVWVVLVVVVLDTSLVYPHAQLELGLVLSASLCVSLFLSVSC